MNTTEISEAEFGSFICEARRNVVRRHRRKHNRDTGGRVTAAEKLVENILNINHAEDWLIIDANDIRAEIGIAERS
jgi:hypothetical protein